MNGNVVFFIIYSIVAVVNVTVVTALLMNLTRKSLENNSEVKIKATSYNKHLLKKALNTIILPILKGILFMMVDCMPTMLTCWLTSFLTKKGILMEVTKGNEAVIAALPVSVFIAMVLGPDIVRMIKERIAKYKKKREKYASLVSEARAKYPNFDSDKETRETILRTIEEYNFSADDDDSFNQIVITKLNNFLTEAAYRKK